MKRLLILLALLPILTFANETEFETLEEELAFTQQLEAQEKADHVRRMAELSALTSNATQEKVEEESEPWLITKIYLWGLLVFGSGAIVCSLVILFASAWKSISATHETGKQSSYTRHLAKLNDDIDLRSAARQRHLCIA